jgi:hypothetical protein
MLSFAGLTMIAGIAWQSPPVPWQSQPEASRGRG